MPQVDDSVLLRALGELAPLGTDRDREQIAALKDRLDAARLRVLVAGEAKRGKSTLINALLGRVVLPAGVTPLTAVATTVRYGDDPHVTARYADGHEEKHQLHALPDLVTERGNPGNRRHIADVIMYLDAPLLAGGVELVDTPGTGSVFDWDTRAAHEALETMDAAVFVLTADPPVSAAERDLYTQVTGLSVTTFTVLNKADHLDDTGWRRPRSSPAASCRSRPHRAHRRGYMPCPPRRHWNPAATRGSARSPSTSPPTWQARAPATCGHRRSPRRGGSRPRSWTTSR